MVSSSDWINPKSIILNSKMKKLVQHRTSAILIFPQLRNTNTHHRFSIKCRVHISSIGYSLMGWYYSLTESIPIQWYLIQKWKKCSSIELQRFRHCHGCGVCTIFWVIHISCIKLKLKGDICFFWLKENLMMLRKM